MAELQPAFERMLRDEGGFVLHTVEGDRGGMTYAGIARNMHPKWPGWAVIDQGGSPSAQTVRDFYKLHFWDDIKGDQITSQAVASDIFNFYVNTGRPAKVLAQLVVGATPDGAFGPRTVQVLNDADPEKFVLAYAIAKITRYRDIVTRDRTQQKFLLGWINRTLNGLKS
jgi:lysozyme family protein